VKIHHYTSIESLALILKNKTIRLNRLDRVDDMEEASLVSSGIKLSQYTFVSCWTYNEKESIPLWKMYAGKEMHGVRISMEKDMFKKVRVFSGNYKGVNILAHEDGGLTILPIEKALTKEYIIIPFCENENHFFRKVVYINNIDDYVKNSVKRIPLSDGTSEIEIKLLDVGTYKHKRWEFQEECRFVLNIFPNTIGSLDYGMVSNNVMNNIVQNIAPKINFYDLEIGQEMLSNICITLSPTCTVSEKIIVESLVHEFAPNAIIQSSDFEGKIINK